MKHCQIPIQHGINLMSSLSIDSPKDKFVSGNSLENFGVLKKTNNLIILIKYQNAKCQT